MTTPAPALAGVFVGGLARRMGGRPKGLLEAPDGRTIVARWSDILSGLGLAVVLVGDDRAYASLGLQSVDDEPPGIGPLGGLVALLRHASSRHAHAHALAFACDMPFVSPSMVERLIAAPDAPVVAPRREGRWEPLCARYDSARMLPLARAAAASPAHSLQRVLDAAGAIELPLTADEALELRDWDSPEDVTAS